MGQYLTLLFSVRIFTFISYIIVNFFILSASRIGEDKLQLYIK